MRGTFLGRVIELSMTYPKEFPAAKAVNLNLYSLHSGVLKEWTQSFLGHYNYF